jgi:hypothetical protein
MSEERAPAADVAPVGPGGQHQAIVPTVVLLLRGRTIPRKSQEAVILAEVITPGGVPVPVNLFVDDLRGMPAGLQISARVPKPDGSGTCHVPVQIKSVKQSDLGDLDIVNSVDGRSIVPKLPEFLRDGAGHRWLRPSRR